MESPSEIMFEIPSADGLTIRAHLALAPESRGRAVVCVHGFKGFSAWGFWPETSRRLVAAGFHALRFDFSHAGVGLDGETFTETAIFEAGTFSGEASDLDTLLRALPEASEGRVDPRRVGILAHSRGSVAALAAAAARRARSAVLWNPISHLMRWDEATRARWRAEGYWQVANTRTAQVFRMRPALLDDAEANAGALDPDRNAARAEIPILTVVAREDGSVSPEEGRRVARSVPAPLGSLREIGETGHTFGATHPFSGTGPPLEAALAATLDHFSRTLPEEAR